MRQEKKQRSKETGKEVKNMIEVARVYKLENSKTLKAFVDISINDVVLIKGIRVVAKKDGIVFAALPSNKAEDGKYYSTVKFLTNEANDEFQKVIRSAYQS